MNEQIKIKCQGVVMHVPLKPNASPILRYFYPYSPLICEYFFETDLGRSCPHNKNGYCILRSNFLQLAESVRISLLGMQNNNEEEVE